MSITKKSTFATLPRTTRGMPMVLGGDPKGKNILYTNGNSVIIRDLENAATADVYTEHAHPTTCAKYSPSGFYISSADKSGKIRIWDTVNVEHILKNEFQPFSGEVTDMSWSSDNQRIAAVGQGREKFGHVFNAETGTSTGEISGQSKKINSCDFKPTRPFRLATASEDMSIAFFEGPPFKYKFHKNIHTNFVNAIRYAPNGEIFVSGGADGKAYVFEGKTGEHTGEFGSPAHKGGIYAVSFSPDSAKLVTVSGDKTAKIWDVATGEMIMDFVFGANVEDMQVGCLWSNDLIITVSLSGYINYLDMNNPGAPSKVIKGHNKPITALALTLDKGTVFSACLVGRIIRWDVNTSDNEVVQGKGHGNQIQSMCVFGDSVITCGLDDKVRFSSVKDMQFGTEEVKLDSQPKGLCVGEGDLVLVACINHVVVIRSGKKISVLPVSYEPLCIGIHPGQTTVAVGGYSDKKIHLYSLNNDTLTEEKTLEMTGQVTCLKFSPDGAWLAAGDSGRAKCVFNVAEEYSTYVTSHLWQHHTAKVTCLSWSPDSRLIASGSIDTNLFVTCLENKKAIMVKGAHKQSCINCIEWVDNHTVITAGQDSNIKQWNITDF